MTPDPTRPRVDEMTDIEVRRLLAALWPTRLERTVDRTAIALWRSGTTDDLRSKAGDRLDDLRSRLQRRRAMKGRHLVGKRPRP